MKRTRDDAATPPHEEAARPSSKRPWSGPHELWTTSAGVLSQVLRNGSIKSILATMRSDQAKPVNALVTETLKRRELLERVLEQCGPWHSEEGHELRLLLAHEMLFGHGLHQAALQRHAADAAVADALTRMRGWEASMLKMGTGHAREAGGEDVAGGGIDVSKLPRYVRVNTLKATCAAVVETLQAEGWTLVDAPRVRKRVPCTPPEPPTFWLDPHVDNLLVMPPFTELHDHSLVRSGALILQDKASCLAPAALAPRPGELVLDCCAAPGNKTTQLAALAAPGGRVIACERDARRAGVLRRRAEHAAGAAVEVRQVDFMDIDVHSAPFCEVSALQLDPTCSGSGMIERSSFQLEAEGHAEAHEGGQAARLVGLAAMQLGLLCRALSFPKARVVVYSTCSVHPAEDEVVVAAALREPAVQRAGWRLAPALRSWPCRGLPLLPGAEMLVRAGPEVQSNGFFVARFERKVPG